MSLTPPPPLTYANRFQKRGKAQTQTQVCLAFPNQEIITAFFIVVVIMIQKGLHINIDLHERNVGPGQGDFPTSVETREDRSPGRECIVKHKLPRTRDLESKG